MMKIFRKLFKPLLAALLLLAATPTWACLRVCKDAVVSLSCVRLCAHSEALLSHDGQLPVLGSSSCVISTAPQVPAIVSAAFELPAPQLHALPALTQSAPMPLLTLAMSPSTRGPPAPNDYLSSQHPYANGPPTLL